MDFPVGFCDVEETVKHILKQLAVALKQSDELFSTGLKLTASRLAELKAGATCFINAADTLNASWKALTSSAATLPSALAILALRTITPTVKGTSLSGSAYSLRSCLSARNQAGS